jgi:hypothetical protein
MQFDAIRCQLFAVVLSLQNVLADRQTEDAAYEPYQMEDGDLGIDEEELARLEAELGSADAEDFDGGSSGALAELETGSALPGYLIDQLLQSCRVVSTSSQCVWLWSWPCKSRHMCSNGLHLMP